MQNLPQPTVRKSLIRFSLILLAISIITHWHDVKNGVIDGLKQGFSAISK